jgi:hypothetical protein
MQSKFDVNKFKGLSSVQLIDLPTIYDHRGILTAIEGAVDIPFKIERCYFLHHLKLSRGGHAHRETSQIIVAASGDCEIQLSDGNKSKIFKLNSPEIGLMFDSMLWIEIPRFSENAVILVLASTHYDSKKTIRNWDEYLMILKSKS